MLDRNKNIVLIGYRCTGKTAIGRRLAKRLKRPFYDTDDLIKNETGRSIPDLVAEKGWAFFREKEQAVVARISDLQDCIIATGGGVVQDEQNVANLKRNGLFIWTSASLDTIQARMKRDLAHTGQRPSLTGCDPIAEVEGVLAERLPVYRRLADFSVDTSRTSIDETVEQIIDWIEHHT